MLLSEPCVRAHKVTHTSFGSLQELAGVKEKLKDNTLYLVTKKELLATDLSGRALDQAPRNPSVLLAALEELFLHSNRVLLFRILSWRLFQQAWGTPGLPTTGASNQSKS